MEDSYTTLMAELQTSHRHEFDDDEGGGVISLTKEEVIVISSVAVWIVFIICLTMIEDFYATPLAELPSSHHHHEFDVGR